LCQTVADDDRFCPSGASDYLSAVYRPADRRLVMMYYRGNPWFAFGLTMPFAAQSQFELVDTLKGVHSLLANTGYFIIGAHALAALLHHYLWKDNTLLRMMPRKR
jgi:cytochrome b561